jgi:hypothetical protein
MIIYVFQITKRSFKWFCHFNDRNYVIIPNLIKFLSDYDYKQYWYFGESTVSYGTLVYIYLDVICIF